MASRSAGVACQRGGKTVQGRGPPRVPSMPQPHASGLCCTLEAVPAGLPRSSTEGTWAARCLGGRPGGRPPPRALLQLPPPQAAPAARPAAPLTAHHQTLQTCERKTRGQSLGRGRVGARHGRAGNMMLQVQRRRAGAAHARCARVAPSSWHALYQVPYLRGGPTRPAPLFLSSFGLFASSRALACSCCGWPAGSGQAGCCGRPRPKCHSAQRGSPHSRPLGTGSKAQMAWHAAMHHTGADGLAACPSSRRSGRRCRRERKA